MWKLKNTKKEHWEQFVFVGEECVVGRKDAALMINNDPSVSRKHAVISLRHPEENLGYPSKKSSLFMRDEGSKYGTFKNGVRITDEEELKDGDVIKFGQFQSEFRVHYIPLVITTSCLDVASRNKLKRVIRQLGGHLVPEWQSSCTHLVMSQVKVTIKALCCLVSLKFIVLPEYFVELEKKLKSSATIIFPKEFIPPIGEALIDKDKVSFDTNPKRKDIFKDKSFFFMDEKQGSHSLDEPGKLGEIVQHVLNIPRVSHQRFKKLHLGIIMGGGSASILAEEKSNIDLLLHKNACFIEPVKGQVKEDSKNFLKEIISALQKKNLRMIPESDIGLAVAYASTETFCNPSFNVGSVVLGSQKIPSQTYSEREVYVPDTEERVQRPSTSKRNSFLNFKNQPKSKKQKLEAPDSSNLTSFRGDAEEIFEIPLSAQVKQELEDIFEETMKATNVEMQNEEMPATLLSEPDDVKQDEEPCEEEIIVSKKVSPKSIKVEINTSIVNGNESPATVSPKRPKVERSTSLVSGDGFSSVHMNGNDETNLPRNLVKVQFVSLIVRKPVASVEQQSRNSQVKNFKKFKKVLPKEAQALPRIIGGHDLIPYDKDAAKLCENWDDDDIEVINNRQPVKGAFDWDTPNA